MVEMPSIIIRKIADLKIEIQAAVSQRCYDTAEKIAEQLTVIFLGPRIKVSYSAIFSEYHSIFGCCGLDFYFKIGYFRIMILGIQP